MVIYRPPDGWSNDPNGLVVVDEIKHLFFQYSPNSNQPQNLSWGHAISNDFVDWHDKGVALPYNSITKEERFSGSAVYDCNNTSSLGSNGGPVVAIYTSNYAEDSTFPDGSPVTKGTQSQSLAFSTDKGMTWKNYSENPVIKHPPPKYADQWQNFRDPKAFWYEPHGKWVLVAVLSELKKAILYSSLNLKNWTYMSDFSSKNAPPNAIWECPDLYEMKVVQQNVTKWVMSISSQPTENKIFEAMYYFVGSFDGYKFVEDKSQMQKRLDYGSDFYAGVTWNNVPNDLRLMIAWVDNWGYATNITDKYRGGLSLVRCLNLIERSNGQYKLIQKPNSDIYKYVKSQRSYTKAEVENGIEFGRNKAYNFIVTILLSRVNETGISLVIENEYHKEEAKIHYDHVNKTIYVEKLNILVDPSSNEKRVKHSAKFDPGLKMVLSIFIDAYALTVFCNEGEIVFTELLRIVTNSTNRTMRLSKGSNAGINVTQLWLAIKN
ncbi:hypothetical protein V9T40_001491 [Parthenolecanium corni]|uniref:Beta-fructofuranosidase n=1 Tax=Parthenolecanium corni TaxID=536013 RepID=A0AAN9TKB5_9HEMI